MRTNAQWLLRASTLVGLTLLVFSACDTTAVCACSDPAFFGVVHGTVLEPGGGGATVPRATIRAIGDVALMGCEARTGLQSEREGRADGTYELFVVGPPRPHTVCLKVVAAPPPERADLLPSDTVAVALPLGALLDSVRVDLTLRAR